MRRKHPVGRILLLLFLMCIAGALAFGQFPLVPKQYQNWLGGLDINLGLDLRGGLHLEYAIDLSGVDDLSREDALNAVQAVIERRVNAIGVGESVVQISSRGAERFLIVELPGIKDIEQAKQIIKETPFLEFREERTDAELTAYFEPLNEEARQSADSAIARVTGGEDFAVVQQELDPFAALTQDGEDQEPVFAKKGDLAGAPELETVLFDETLETGSVHPEIVESEVAYHIVQKGEVRGEGTDMEVAYELITFIKQSMRTNPGAIYKSTELTGEQLEKAEVTYSHQGVQSPEVSIFFNSEGADLFSALTKRSIGKTIAIAVDDQVVSAPTVSQELFGGTAQITGRFTVDEANNLAQRLNEGALPVPIKLVSQQSVEASLGEEALAVSLKAGLFGLLLVMIYMIVYYRFLGLIAAFAIGFYAIVIIAILKISSVFPAGLAITLTLSGIAGLILSVGMAVDANILIYERIKEELKRGRRLKHAVEEGFSRAWSAILDGNLSTIITCLILVIIGTGFVKGFALILIIGVLVSMATAFVLVRMILCMFAGEWLESRPYLMGGDVANHKEKKVWDVIGNRKLTYSISAGLMVVSLIMIFTFGLKPGIEFVSGTLVEIRTTQVESFSRESVCEGLSGEICGPSFTTQKSEEDRVIIKYKSSDEEQNEQVIAALKGIDPEMEILRTDFIGAEISDQLKGNAITAIIMAIALILLFIAIVFRKISFPVSSWSYGFTAIVALVHDIVIVLGFFAFFGMAFGVEIGIPFLVALLTILGYSINDTIVVYDRVRENILRTKNLDKFPEILNQSLNETFARSINTSLTVAVVLIAIIIWGSASLMWFAVALLIGVLAGTHSSIFVATALVASIHKYKKDKGLLK